MNDLVPLASWQRNLSWPAEFFINSGNQLSFTLPPVCGPRDGSKKREVPLHLQPLLRVLRYLPAYATTGNSRLVIFNPTESESESESESVRE